MATILELGHVGIHVKDLEHMKNFYQKVLGLTVTDESAELGMVFLSARPSHEHHELLLCRGRNVDDQALLVQQISFRCHSLADVVEFYHRVREAQCPIDMVVSHGNAIGVYFFDPEGNRVEVYVSTGLSAQQPYLEHLDFSCPPDEIMQQVEASVRQHDGRSFVDHHLLEGQNL